jgi:molybdate/tungstate transport system substrate-binding protein
MPLPHRVLVICGLTLCALAALLDAQTSRLQLNVCHAGSLQAAFAQVEEEFKKQHPDTAIVDSSGGSVDLARRLAAGNLQCDVYAPADHLIIDLLLKPARLADYSIMFASGRMVLAYLATDPNVRSVPTSGTFAPPSSVPELAGNLPQVLTAPGVRIAGAHPFLDPGGYRAHMIFELAQTHYKMPGLYNALLQHYQVVPTDLSTTGAAPQLGKDFNFQIIYEHSAAAAAKRDASYRYAALPREIDLSSDSRQYAASSVTIPGLGIPASRASVTIPASRVEWGVTIPTNARNRETAIAFVTMLLGPVGRAAPQANGPAPIVPARVKGDEAQRMPSELRTLTRAQ